MSVPAICTFLVFILGTIGQSTTVLKTVSRQQNGRSYSSTNGLLTQYAAKSKMHCIAQCARLSSTCNIAVFNPSFSITCSLYGDSLIPANLTYSLEATTVDFSRNIIPTVYLLLPGMTALSTYSIMTMGELSTDSDVYGPVIVCGSILSNSPINFVRGIDPNKYPVASYGLQIHSQIGSGGMIKVYAGSLGLSTNFSRTITASTNKSYTVDGRPVSIEEGNCGASVKINPNLTSKCISMENDLRTLSSQLNTLSNISENNISIPIFSSAPLKFYVNGIDTNGIATFYMHGNTALNNPFTQNIEIVIDPGISRAVELIVINLSGTNITFTEGNMDGTWLTSTNGRSKTIWNFNQATTITLTKRWMGAFLAPDASMTTDSDVDGVIAVRCLMSTGKVNDPLFVMPSWA